MFIITEKETGKIIMMGSQLDYMSNGYPRLVEENVAFPTDIVNVHEVESIPDGVEEGKYCYTPEYRFYENPDYQEPDSKESVTEQEVIDSIIAEVCNE